MGCESESSRETGFFKLFGLASPRLDVRWEPSPSDVVDRMIAMAKVRAADIVYDLGCGDGRCVITAARQKGAHAVGIDLDPRRIKECGENALREQVDGLVRFLNADFFHADISEASVLFLFLFPNVNLRLRPKLLAELRPGARIVSYCHDMERWMPDERTEVRANYLYLWTVPANVSGRWEGAMQAKGRVLSVRLELQQQFQTASGTARLGDEVFSLRRVSLEGNRFRCNGRESVHGDSVILMGSVKGDLMEGVVQRDEVPGETCAWTARRDPSTRIPLA